MALPWFAAWKAITTFNKRNTIGFLITYQNVQIRSYCRTSNLYARASKIPSQSYLKSSKPLTDPNGSKKREKPRQYEVIGGFSVDKETFQKILEEEMEDDDFDENDFNDVLLHCEDYYDLHKMEEKDFRRRARLKMLKRKMFPTPPEKSLMTCAAREQVRFLHRTDPQEWTPQKIAEHFPISVDGARKLIRTKFSFLSEKRIKAHDKSVEKNWDAIREGHTEGLDQILQERWRNKQLSPTQALPNPAFPTPPPTNTNPSPLLLDDPTKPVGEFYSIVKPYIDMKRQLELTNETSECSRNPNVMNMNQDDDDDEDDEPSDWMRIGTSPTLTDDLGEIDERSYRRTMRRETHVTRDQFELNMKEKLEKKVWKTEEDERMLEWLKSRTFLEAPKMDNCTSKDLPNTADQPEIHQVKMANDTPKNEQRQEPITVSHEHYQNLSGKRDNIFQKFKKEKQVNTINDSHNYQHQVHQMGERAHKSKYGKRVKVQDDLYRVGNSFYSEDGDFLYKVFTDIK